MSATAPIVRWAKLAPNDFRARRDMFLLVGLPLGLVQSHGLAAPVSIDLRKANLDYETAARRFGSIAVTSHDYHIHVAGPHAPWLAKWVAQSIPSSSDCRRTSFRTT